MEATMTWVGTKMASIAQLVEMVNFQFPGGRWQLFEVCDLSLYGISTVFLLASNGH